ncbi:uncharacterized protein BO66DRAFT_421642 [Aspergillus aculeatinus CBS 121060]|uniref:Uncharacterized protein n=1 Tax=Aspergillus aculeatinus CBS 121060 TaxID=1448322 RepID=A0ACD1H470_9EURO|nr:hypothetical protein BO66DRAFT_421642 [Aspergillus aculeatinus CBS 121060]RAH68368.1 hypothetical protein BO66DRAFT_421642 [Aspergillus aculeatinus CBS 121060]
MNPSSSEYASDDKGPTILIVLWTLTVLTIVVVTGRIYIRAGLLHNLGLMGLVCCILTTINVRLGSGKHAWLLSAATVEHATFLNCLDFLFDNISFTVPNQAVTTKLNQILNASHIQLCIIILFTMCDPLRALWQTGLVTEGKATSRMCGSLSRFVDLVLVIYSSTVLMKLQMSLRKRLALCAALGLGSLKGLADQEAYTYQFIWTKLQCIESSIGIIASCIPTLQHFLELMHAWQPHCELIQQQSQGVQFARVFPQEP